MKVGSMRFFSEKYRLLSVLGLVLIAGFLAATMTGYPDARDRITENTAQVLAGAGDTLQAEIQKDLLRPVLTASMMAQDIFLRDWMLNGETDPALIARYLNEIAQKNGATGVFLASGKTLLHYAADGTARPLQQSEPDDAWFFRIREMKEPYETSIAADPASGGTMNIAIRHRISDANGDYLGVVGLRIAVDTMARLIESDKSRPGHSIYLVDAKGNAVLTGIASKPAAAPLQERPGMRDIASRILNGSNNPIQLEYRLDDATVLVNSRFIPELGWHLVIEKNLATRLRPVQQALMLSLIIGAITIMLALIIVLFATNRDRKRMERMASIDPLTGLLNRQAFEIVLEQSMLDIKRSGQPISAILFDIDSFQEVNDKHGHQVGDQVLRTIAQLARGVVRDNDIITRWSGKEFLILLRECPLEIAVGVSEKLRHAIASQDFGLPSPPQAVTTSLGVAQFGFQESQISFFMRIDKALRDAKNAGRNRTIASVRDNQDQNIAAAVARRK